MVLGECDISVILKIKMVKEPKIRMVFSFEPVILLVFTGQFHVQFDIQPAGLVQFLKPWIEGFYLIYPSLTYSHEQKLQGVNTTLVLNVYVMC